MSNEHEVEASPLDVFTALCARRGVPVRVDGDVVTIQIQVAPRMWRCGEFNKTLLWAYRDIDPQYERTLDEMVMRLLSDAK